MPGTILLTGANGSLAVPAVQHMLESYPSFTLVLAVRDDSDQDPNTVALRKTISAHPDANVFIRKLDMSSLDEVKSFSETLRSEVEQGKLPRIASIICNAFSWKLSGGPGFSKEGFESTMAISHLAHFAMVLRLLSAMEAQHGRIVFLGSEAHWPERAGLSKGGFPTKLPGNLDTLVHPSADPKDQEMGLGFQRYGWSKLVITMVANELSRRLKEVLILRIRCEMY
jgi:NAD(P)-dependent dehydrogenase (short-subunit alcohol dehydrogenase family)